MTEKARLWIKAVKTLFENPLAVVKCPECGVGTMFFRDELISTWDKLDRYIICNVCRRYNALTIDIPDDYHWPNHIIQEFVERQKELCEKHNTEFFPSHFNQLIGVALKSFENKKKPVNGLRHPIQNEQSANWYIWAGEYSDADDFFSPIHLSHLLKICPKAIDYLALPPGWRFLFDNNYEDVWYDENLLKL